MQSLKKTAREHHPLFHFGIVAYLKHKHFTTQIVQMMALKVYEKHRINRNDIKIALFVLLTFFSENI